MNAIDTNIWIYSHDKRYPRKQQLAHELIATASPLALPWQVGCEFIAASRKLEQCDLTQDEAWGALRDMTEMANAILLPVPELWVESRHLQDRFGFSFWDALLVAACKRGEVTRLYTEDFTSGIDVDGLEIVNPFLLP